MSTTYTPRTETVVILQGDDDEQLRQYRAYAESLRFDADRLRPRSEPKAAAQPMGDASRWEKADAEATEAEQVANDFAVEASRRGVTVVLRSVGRKAWRDLFDKHPPRDGNEGDEAVGVNLDTLPDDLVPACMGSPVFESDGEQEAFLDSLSAAEFGRLGQVAWLLNTRTSADPKAVLGSKPSPT